LSWAAVIAGALTATAITFILLSLGAGIGFMTASPFSSGPSATTLTAIAAIWIVLSQTWGYACGGYLAARLRGVIGAPTSSENNFRDGAHGFVVWALGVLLTLVMVSIGSAFAVGTAAHVGGTVGAGAAQSDSRSATDTTGYFADMLVRSSAAADAPTATPPASASQATSSNAEIGRVLAASAVQGRLSDADRDYLTGVVMARTGLPQAQARQRVTDVENQIRDTAKQAADKAAKAASMFSFWTFMSLLMGAMAAIAGGIVGGNQRDDFANVRLNMVR
jgi:hypothetical protein